jgi:hypothetical protein
MRRWWRASASQSHSRLKPTYDGLDHRAPAATVLVRGTRALPISVDDHYHFPPRSCTAPRSLLASAFSSPTERCTGTVGSFAKSLLSQQLRSPHLLFDKPSAWKDLILIDSLQPGIEVDLLHR